MSTSVFLATGNTKKLTEMHQLLSAEHITGIDVLTINDFSTYEEPVEDGTSFSDNALIKARAGAQQTGLPSLADDSGLRVAALNAMPGIFSARWAGLSSQVPSGERDTANLQLILAQISDVPDERRQADYISVCALVFPDGREYIYEGIWTGTLTRTPQGTQGFGYDPIFAPDEYAGSKVAAELSVEQKNVISHRGKALALLIPQLRLLGRPHEQ